MLSGFYLFSAVVLGLLETTGETPPTTVIPRQVGSGVGALDRLH